MYKIEYDITLNDDGRPCIELPVGYDQKPEDRFFALEITRYMLHDLLSRGTERLDNKTIDVMETTESLIGQLSDEVSWILYGQMKAMGDVTMSMGNPFHINVESLEERDSLTDEDIQYDNKLFDRVEGLKVNVVSYNIETFIQYNDIYELVGGISNEHWVKLPA